MNQVSCRLMRLKTIQIQLKPVQIIDLEFLIRTPRSVKPGLNIDQSVRITESILSRSVKIGLEADESVRVIDQKDYYIIKIVKKNSSNIHKII